MKKFLSILLSLLILGSFGMVAYADESALPEVDVTAEETGISLMGIFGGLIEGVQKLLEDTSDFFRSLGDTDLETLFELDTSTFALIWQIPAMALNFLFYAVQLLTGQPLIGIDSLYQKLGDFIAQLFQ